jgi:peptide-methionine (R)-S-oxide reductase
MDRRELLGMASVGAVAAVFFGRSVVMNANPEAASRGLKVSHSDLEWRAKLSPVSYEVLRKRATEKPFTSPLVAEHRKGMFACAGCDQLLFSSSTKYDSKTGWPSFWDVLPGAISKHPDFEMAHLRTEVRCSSCAGHLGHVFVDGPKPTGQRYCMNGVALAFRPAAA